MRAAEDRYVPRDEPHWDWVKRDWAGCEVRELAAGHVTGSILSLEAYQGGIKGVAERVARQAWVRNE